MQPQTRKPTVKNQLKHLFPQMTQAYGTMAHYGSSASADAQAGDRAVGRARMLADAHAHESDRIRQAIDRDNRVNFTLVNEILKQGQAQGTRITLERAKEMAQWLA